MFNVTFSIISTISWQPV